MPNNSEAKNEAPPKYPTRLQKHWLPTDVFWMTADEYAAEFVGTWVITPRDFADSLLGRGVRSQVTKKSAYEAHAEMARTALMFGSAMPVETVTLHKLKLPRGKGYVRNGDFYIVPKRKTKKKVQSKSRRRPK